MDDASDERSSAEKGVDPSLLRRVVTLAFGFSGAAALIYEVAWTRELSLVFGSTVYAMSIMLAAFMFGLSLGAWVGGKWADGRALWGVKSRGNSPVELARDVALVECGIGICGLATPLVVTALPWLQYRLLTVFAPPAGVFFGFQMVLAFLVMLLPTTLMGATLPLVSKINVSSRGSVGETIGRLYASNTLGSVAGSLLAGFVLMPTVGVRATILIAAIGNFCVAITLLLISRRRPGAPLLIAVFVVLIVGGIVAGLPDPVEPLSFTTIIRYDSYDAYLAEVRQLTPVFSQENAYSRVTVGQYPDGSRILVDGPLIEGSNNPGDEATTHILSFLPAAFSRSPSSALVIGLGTGTTTKAMLSLPVKSVTTVEINPSMRRAADFFVGSSLNDPRWHYEQTDARQFMSADAKRYDVISSEPSWPVASSVSQLFTLEFFQLAKSRLQPGGVFCQWVPQYLVPKDDFVMLFRTFRTVFPGAQVWAMEDDFGQPGDLFLVGVEGGSYADSATVAAAVGDELAKSGVKGVRVKRAFSSGQLDADASQPGPLNTDDKPLLEFHVPWALVSHAVERIRGAK